LQINKSDIRIEELTRPTLWRPATSRCREPVMSYLKIQASSRLILVDIENQPASAEAGSFYDWSMDISPSTSTHPVRLDSMYNSRGTTWGVYYEKTEEIIRRTYV
jgi:hypothetical protein